jgi:hypothetical protein
MLKLGQRAFREEDGKAELLVGEARGHAEQSDAQLRELAHGILSRGGVRAEVRGAIPLPG